MDKIVKNKIIKDFGDMKDLIYKILVWCSGSDTDNLELVPTGERIKHAQYGALVLIPAIVGLFSMTYAISTLTSNVVIFILAGITWSVIVLTIDRFVVSTLNRNQLKKGFWCAFIIRILYAIFVGLIVGHPIVLLILNDDIELKLKERKISYYETNTKRIDTINHKYDTLKARISSTLDSLEADVDSLEAMLTHDLNGGVVVSLRYGRTSEDKGYGTSARNFEMRINGKKAQIESTKITTRIEIQKNDSMRKSDIESIITNAKSLDSAFSKSYLSRTNELAEIKGIHVTVLFYLIILFFMVLDTIPIVFKLISAAGLYEILNKYIRRNMDVTIYPNAPEGINSYKKLRVIKNYKLDTDISIEKEKNDALKSCMNNGYGAMWYSSSFEDIKQNLDDINGIEDLYRKNDTTRSTDNEQSASESLPKNTIDISTILAYAVLFIAHGAFVYEVNISAIGKTAGAMILFASDFFALIFHKTLYNFFKKISKFNKSE